MTLPAWGLLRCQLLEQDLLLTLATHEEAERN